MKNQILYFLTNKSFLENLIHYFFTKDLKCITFENLLFSARKKIKFPYFKIGFVYGKVSTDRGKFSKAVF